uniref:Uncharacterized protein n=1 Tax=Trichuris muris TaxID=70415 RepID=A0A5S6QB59_TRIMR
MRWHPLVRGKDVCVIQLQYFGDDEERLNRLHVDSPACVSELEICIVSDLSGTNYVDEFRRNKEILWS